MIDIAIKELLDFSSDTYETLLYQMPEKQRALFVAIASAGKAKTINGRICTEISSFISQFCCLSRQRIAGKGFHHE